MKIIEFWLILGFCWQVKALKYACPSKAWCVPSENCMKGSETYIYNATGQTTLVEFLCGVVSTEGYVCCEEKGVEIPNNYTPTKRNWFYPKGNQTVIRGLEVLPWPGQEAPEVFVPVLRKTPAICPSFSFCLLPGLCPSVAIRYSAFLDSTKRYQCGHTWDTGSWTCCSVHLFVNSVHNALTVKAPVARRVRKISSVHEIPKYSPKLNHYSKAVNSLSKPRFENVAASRKRRDLTDLANSMDTTNDINVNDTIITIPAVDTLQVAPTNNSEFSGRTAEAATSGTSETSCGMPTGEASAIPSVSSFNTNLTNAGLTREGQYPWHVAILSSTREYLCGGTIISARHVITVAHCIDEYTASTLKVRIGDYDLTSNTESFPSYDVELSSIVFHPNYTRATLKADLAVLVLKFPVLSLPNVARVCFPGEREITGQEECFVPGWASVTPARQGSPRITNFHPTLKEAGLVIIGRERCQYQLRKVKSLGTFFKLLDGITCVKGIHQRDSCHGDGGSGVVCRASTGDFVLQGLISWSVGCDRGLPTALVDIEFYSGFILNVIRGFQFSSTSFNEATAAATEGSTSFSVDPLLSGIQSGFQSTSGNINHSSTISSSGFGTSQTFQSSGTQSSYSQGQAYSGNAQNNYFGHVQGSSSNTNFQTNRYESSSTAQNAQNVFNAGSHSSKRNQHSYNSASHATSSGIGTYVHVDNYQTSFGSRRPYGSHMQQGSFYGDTYRNNFGGSRRDNYRRDDYLSEDQEYERQRYLEQLEDLEYYNELKQEAYAKKEYYDGFAGGYDGYVDEDHDTGRYGEEYFDTFDEYLDKYDRHDNEGSSHRDYTSGSIQGEDYGSQASSNRYASETDDDDSYGFEEHNFDSVYSHSNRLDRHQYDSSSSHGGYNFGFNSENSEGSSTYEDYGSDFDNDESHNYDSSSGFRGHDYDSSSSFRGHAYDSSSSFRGHDYDTSSDFRGHNYDTSSDFRGHNYDTSSDFRGHNYDTSSDFRGHNYDTSSDFRGHNYDGSSRFRGHDYDGSSRFRDHDYDSSSGFRGHSYSESFGYNEYGADIGSNSGYDFSNQFREGHDYDGFGGSANSKYDNDLRFNEHAGYESEFGHGRYMYGNNREGLEQQMYHNSASEEYLSKSDRYRPGWQEENRHGWQEENRHGWQEENIGSSSFNYEKEHNAWHDKHGKEAGRQHETWHEGHKQFNSLNQGGATSDQNLNTEHHARQAEENSVEDNEQTPSDADDFVPGQSIVGFLRKRYMGNE